MKRINRIGETDVIRGSRAVVLAAALMGVAAASQAQVRALGPGVGVSCGVWLEARTDPEGPLVFGLLSWVLGYITGAATTATAAPRSFSIGSSGPSTRPQSLE